jgi:hypothetical protein
VFVNVTALVTVPPPFIATLYGCATVFNVAAVKAPLKVTVPVVSVSVTVVAVTAPANVVPPLSVTVTTPMSVPTTPPTLTTPVVLKATFDAAPSATPLIVPVVIAVATPVPSTSVAIMIAIFPAWYASTEKRFVVGDGEVTEVSTVFVVRRATTVSARRVGETASANLSAGSLRSSRCP